MPERGIFCFKNMGERDQIRPGAILPVIKEGSDSESFMKVQGVLEDGRVIISYLGSRRPTTFVTTQGVILGGGTLEDGRLGRLMFPGQLTESPQ